MSDSLASHGLSAASSSVHGNFQAREYWNGLPFSSPGDLPNPGIEPGSPALQADALSSEPLGKPQYGLAIRKVLYMHAHDSESESRSVVSDSLCPQGLYSPWNSPGQNTGVGSHSLLQGIVPTQRSNQGLLHCRQILYQLSYQESLKKILLHR